MGAGQATAIARLHLVLTPARYHARASHTVLSYSDTGARNRLNTLAQHYHARCIAAAASCQTAFTMSGISMNRRLGLEFIVACVAIPVMLASAQEAVSDNIADNTATNAWIDKTYGTASPDIAIYYPGLAYTWTTYIDVGVRCEGTAPECFDVEVELKYRTGSFWWFGPWNPIGSSQTIASIPVFGAGNPHTLTWTKVFSNLGFYSWVQFHAEIISWGGNALGNTVMFDDDRGQRRVKKVRQIFKLPIAVMKIPITNGHDESVAIENLRAVCVSDDDREVNCGGAVSISIEGLADGDLVSGPREIKSNSDLELVMSVNGTLPGTSVRIAAEEVGADGQVVAHSTELHFEFATVEEVLNRPAVCCIGSIKTRLLLERKLANALAKYEEGDCRGTLTLLRSFLNTASLLRCELDFGEIRCLEDAVLDAVDVGRMVAAEFGAPEEALHQGDLLKWNALFDAALFHYARSCPRAVAAKKPKEIVVVGSR